MSTYLESVIADKKYKGNVVIQIGANYFSIRQPDSGLVIPSPYDKCVSGLLLNPTQIDIRTVTTTISTFSFRLLDKNGIITALVLGDAANLIKQTVRIFLGRSGVGMAFADYFELPQTIISKCDHADNSYNFQSTEQTDRMARPIYDFKSALDGDILTETTIWTMRDSIADFPTSGFLKVDDEFVSYSGVDLSDNRFLGVIRGELGSTPATHDANTDVILVETVTGNPLDIILKILISGGGGGTYDVLQDGLGISESLIDIDEIETLRDELFVDVEFTLSLHSIPSTLKYLESELLMPNNLRFTNSRNSKITLAILDRAQFVEDDDIIDHDTMTKFPKWSIDGRKVTNVLIVEWDYVEGTTRFNERSTYEDAESIAAYGRQTPLTYQFKGPKAADGGEDIIENFATRLLARLAFPTPEIQISTHIDKSLQTIGDKTYLVSNKIPAADGTLNFASNLEIVSRAINLTNGDVQFKLAFTSFTNIRSGFVAPSDLIQSVISQKKVTIPGGRAGYYTVGWYLRLWDEVNQEYVADPPNRIVAITSGVTSYLLAEDGDILITEDGEALTQESLEDGDVITFEDNFATTLTEGGDFRIRFANYDEVIESQKRYCFISDGGADFDDGKPTYKVTY